MILKGLNTSSFLNYFFLTEDILKNLYFEKTSSNNNFLTGSKIISLALKNILETENILNEFDVELYKRSKFFINLDSLEEVWTLMNFIRNRVIHYNGYYDDKAKETFLKYFENILKMYRNNNDMLVSINLFINIFEEYQKQINESSYLIIDDRLENTIRNISIFIMESLYVCYKNKIKN
jgi:hypothetical protein